MPEQTTATRREELLAIAGRLFAERGVPQHHRP